MQYAIAVKCAGHVATPGMATYDNADGDNGWYLDKRSCVPRFMLQMSHPWQSYASTSNVSLEMQTTALARVAFCSTGS